MRNINEWFKDNLYVFKVINLIYGTWFDYCCPKKARVVGNICTTIKLISLSQPAVKRVHSYISHDALIKKLLNFLHKEVLSLSRKHDSVTFFWQKSICSFARPGSSVVLGDWNSLIPSLWYVDFSSLLKAKFSIWVRKTTRPKW